MNNRNQDKKSPPIGKIIGLLVILFSLPADAIPILIVLGAIGFLIFLAVKRLSGNSSGRSAGRSTRRETFDECPQPIFCFHKDKGEHHVRRGKEIDPWDRPDIDISKYQRK